MAEKSTKSHEATSNAEEENTLAMPLAASERNLLSYLSDYTGGVPGQNKLLDSEDDFRSGCRNVSQCHLKQSFSGLHSPGRSYFTL